ETQVAENYLMRIKGSTVPEYLNTAGVIMALSGDYDIAENIFRAAAASGLKAAKANLAHLARRNQQ
ncbi:MAG: cell envelope biogenesis protein OmpA, partial [Mucinivorans sp.]